MDKLAGVLIRNRDLNLNARNRNLTNDNANGRIAWARA